MSNLYKLKAQLAVMRDIEKDYGYNRSVGNVIQNIESKIKTLERTEV